MKILKIGLLFLLTSLAGCTSLPKPTFPPLFIFVNNASGTPAVGAEVFLNGELRGSTDAAGKLTISGKLPSGPTLFARHRVYTHPSYRPGTDGGWITHVYQTSRLVNNNGTVTDFTVTDPTVTQTLTVSPGNALIGWHLIASLDWDASTDEINQLKTRFEDASQYLYDLTDGQFFIEEVELADDAQLYLSAEITFKVDSDVWPHATYNGGYLAAVGGLPHIYMAPFGVTSSDSQQPRTLMHELGHLAMGLADEYSGPFNQGCTAARRNPGPGTLQIFRDNGASAACFMDRQMYTNKICSAHADSFHSIGNWQPGPCWNTIIGAYADPSGTNRWILKTPDMRNAVVGTLNKLPPGLQPKVTPDNNNYPDLCAPFTYTDKAKASAANGVVWVRPKSWRTFNFSVGKLDSSGTLKVRGVHMGDLIQSNVSPPVLVTSAMCTITN